ncbi:MAG: diguanylate cyclase [Candidatus Melainabacteria bacterium]|nr:diguanylate cyclase [Candidatus Melainabacteria bacterium]
MSFTESIHIVASSQPQAAALQTSIQLRGFDRVRSYAFSEAKAHLAQDVPALVIVDGSKGQMNTAMAVIEQLSKETPSLLIADAFEEEAFLTCHDAGTKAFLTVPVSTSYLIAHIIDILNENTLRQQLTVRDALLQELGAFSADSGLYQTEHMIRLLQYQIRQLGPDRNRSLAVVLLEVGGFDRRLTLNPRFRRALYQHLAAALKTCCRGSDLLGEYYENKFLAILPHTGLDGAQTVSQRMHQELGGHRFSFEGQQITLQLQTGSAHFENCLHYEDLINKAIAALKTPTTPSLGNPAGA